MVFDVLRRGIDTIALGNATGVAAFPTATFSALCMSAVSTTEDIRRDLLPFNLIVVAISVNCRAFTLVGGDGQYRLRRDNSTIAGSVVTVTGTGDFIVTGISVLLDSSGSARFNVQAAFEPGVTAGSWNNTNSCVWAQR